MQQLFWSITPNGMPILAKRCPKCGHPHYTSGGQFRVNANGGLVDVWLVYRCGRCKATWNLEVLARTRPSAISRAQYERFLANNPALALQCAFDPRCCAATMRRSTLKRLRSPWKARSPRNIPARSHCSPLSRCPFPPQRRLPRGSA